MPKVENIRRHAGIAGQFSVTADVSYGPGESVTHAEFVGSVHGGPVVAITPVAGQMFVTAPERFGNFGDDPIAWIQRFFA